MVCLTLGKKSSFCPSTIKMEKVGELTRAYSYSIMALVFIVVLVRTERAKGRGMGVIKNGPFYSHRRPALQSF